jgi:hypothetical protein
VRHSTLHAGLFGANTFEALLVATLHGAYGNGVRRCHGLAYGERVGWVALQTWSDGVLLPEPEGDVCSVSRLAYAAGLAVGATRVRADRHRPRRDPRA